MRRRLVERIAVALCVAALLLALLPLFHLVYTAISIGGSRLSWSFISTPASGLPYIGAQGGVLNGLVGTIILLFLGSLLAVPLGVISGIYLMEFGSGSVGGLVRTITDTLLSVPSVIWGLFGFLFLASTASSFGLHWNFCALAGGVILGLVMSPVIARVTELSLVDVPHAYREASLALGASRWYTMRRIGLRVARPGIMSGVLLALTNALGQTAALLLVNGYSLTMPHWPLQLAGQGNSVGDMASLIYVYYEQPAPPSVLQPPAEAAALVLLLLVLAMSLLSRAVIALGAKNYVR